MEIDAENLLNLIFEARKHLINLSTTKLRSSPDLKQVDYASGSSCADFEVIREKLGLGSRFSIVDLWS